MIWENIRLQRANTLLMELCEIMDEDPTFTSPSNKLEKLQVLAQKAWSHLEKVDDKPRERQMVRVQDFVW